MTSKTEEKIKKMLDNQLEQQLSTINKRVAGVFLYGFISGVIMSYSGFLSYLAGIGTGVLIAKKYEYISYQITEKASYLLQNSVNMYKKYI